MDGNGHNELSDIRAVLAEIAARQARHEHMLEQHGRFLEQHGRLFDQHGAAMTAIDARLDHVGTLLDRFAAESGERMGRVERHLEVLADICDGLIRNKQDKKRKH